MFMGTYEHKLDVKSRLVLPSKFREQLGSNVYVTISIEQCVALYPENEWQALRAKVQDGPFYTSEKARLFSRMFFSSAHELSIDGAGRILLPPVLRGYAAITQDVVLNGVNDHIEIWDHQRWSSYWQDGISKLSELMEGAGTF